MPTESSIALNKSPRMTKKEKEEAERLRAIEVQKLKEQKEMDERIDIRVSKLEAQMVTKDHMTKYMEGLFEKHMSRIPGVGQVVEAGQNMAEAGSIAASSQRGDARKRVNPMLPKRYNESRKDYVRGENKPRGRGAFLPRGRAIYDRGHVTTDQVYERRSSPHEIPSGRGRGRGASRGGTTRADIKNIKEFVRYEQKDKDSETELCKFQIIVNCIRSFEGDFADEMEHIREEVEKMLTDFDKDLDAAEIMHVQRIRSPAGHELIRAIVYFSNIETPERLASKAEKDGNDEILQRSLPRHIRERNADMDDHVKRLNEQRPQNNPYLWAVLMLKGKKFAIKMPDPLYKKPPVITLGVEGAAATAHELQQKLQETGSVPAKETVIRKSMTQGLKELQEETDGDKDEMIEILMKRSDFYHDE